MSGVGEAWLASMSSWGFRRSIRKRPAGHYIDVREREISGGVCWDEGVPAVVRGARRARAWLAPHLAGASAARSGTNLKASNATQECKHVVCVRCGHCSFHRHTGSCISGSLFHFL